MEESFHVKNVESRLWLKKLPNNFIPLKDSEDKLDNYMLSGDSLVFDFQLISSLWLISYMVTVGGSPRGKTENGVGSK